MRPNFLELRFQYGIYIFQKLSEDYFLLWFYFRLSVQMLTLSKWFLIKAAFKRPGTVPKDEEKYMESSGTRTYLSFLALLKLIDYVSFLVLQNLTLCFVTSFFTLLAVVKDIVCFQGK
jgi:hypothetical protein